MKPPIITWIIAVTVIFAASLAIAGDESSVVKRGEEWLEGLMAGQYKCTQNVKADEKQINPSKSNKIVKDGTGAIVDGVGFTGCGARG